MRTLVIGVCHHWFAGLRNMEHTADSGLGMWSVHNALHVLLKCAT